MRFFLFWVVLGLCQNTSFAVEVVKVGLAFKFGPTINNSADPVYQGILFAKEQFEKKNKFIKIELVKYSFTPEQSTREKVAQQVIADHVKFVVGGLLSEEAMALGDQFKGHDILFITPTSSNPRVTSADKPNVFRVCFSDDQVAEALAKYVLSQTQMKSIGVLHNTSDAYTDYLTTEFLKQYDHLKDNQNQVKFSEFRYAGEKPKFSSAVEKFKRDQVDTVVAFTLQDDLEGFFAAAQKAQFHPLYFGSDGWSANETLEKMKGFKAIRNAYWYQESKAPAVKNFVKEYEKANHVKPDSVNAIAYDSMMVLLDSVLKAKNKQSVSEVAGILKASHFHDLVTSEHFEFNEHHSPNKTLYLYQVDNNGSKFLKGIE